MNHDVLEFCPFLVNRETETESEREERERDFAKIKNCFILVFPFACIQGNLKILN